jgi:hypothetical protein
MMQPVIRRMPKQDTVLTVWCELTGHDATVFEEPEREAFLARGEVAWLATVPEEVLRDAGAAARRGRSLPLERWLAAVRVVRPARVTAMPQGSLSSA